MSGDGNCNMNHHQLEVALRPSADGKDSTDKLSCLTDWATFSVGSSRNASIADVRSDKAP
jgi:hypothetical protein